MLMMIGAVAVEVWPFNATEYTETDEATFAEKAVVGRRPPLEAVGEGNSTLKVSGKIFPHKLGGLEHLALLQAQRAAQTAIPVMRGDGVPLGWFVIDQVEGRSSHLGRDGVGQVVAVDVSLKRSDPPGVAGIVSFLAGLFA